MTTQKLPKSPEVKQYHHFYPFHRSRFSLILFKSIHIISRTYLCFSVCLYSVSGDYLQKKSPLFRVGKESLSCLFFYYFRRCAWD
jgi:hypothetical protein